MQEAQRLFFNTSFKLTTNAQRHLGAAIGTSNVHANMPQKKSQNGAMNSTVLPTLQKHMQPIQHSHTMPTYKSIYINIHTIYIHIYQHTYSMRTILGMHEFIKPVDDVIRLELLPELLNSIVPEVDRQLYSLLLRHGSLGIPILSEISESQFEALQAITLPLVTIMITQGNTLPNKTEVNEIKRKITNKQEVCISEQALKVEQGQTSHTLKAIQDAKMPGASS